MTSEQLVPDREEIGSGETAPISKLVTLASDPKVVQLLLLVLVLDAVGLLDKAIIFAAGAC